MGIDLEKELSLFRRFLIRSGKQLETALIYVTDIRTLVPSGNYKNLQEVANVVARRANTMDSWSNYSTNTKSRYASTARAFLRYQERLKKITRVPIIFPVKTEQGNSPTVSWGDFSTIMKKISYDYRGFRDKLIFYLMMKGGLRTTEALALKISDTKYTGERYQVTIPQPSKESQEITLDEETTNIFRTYLYARGRTRKKKSMHLFPATHTRKALTIRCPRKNFQEYAKLAGIKGVELHHLRNTHIISLIPPKTPKGDLPKLTTDLAEQVRMSESNMRKLIQQHRKATKEED